MRLSTIILPDLLPKAEESVIERSSQLIPITLKNSGNGPIYCMAFRNMRNLITAGLQERCCLEVFLPSGQKVAQKCKVKYRPGETDIALQFMQNSVWTFPQKFYYQDPTSLTVYSFSETEEEMLQQTLEMLDVFKEIFKKLELHQTFNIKDCRGKYSGIMTPNLNGTETCFYSPKQKVGFRKNIFFFSRNGLEQILQEFGLEQEELKESKTSKLVDINTLGKVSPDYVAFVSKKQKLSCFVVKYELCFKTIMDTIICDNTGISGFIWPKAIAPFKILLICPPGSKHADLIYDRLCSSGVSVLYDDRDIPLDEKANWASQFGIYERFYAD